MQAILTVKLEIEMPSSQDTESTANTPSLAHLEELVLRVAERVESMQSDTPAPFTTFVNSLGDEELEVRRPIPLTIRRDDDSYIASFVEANISSGGDTLPDAVESAQSLIASFFTDVEKLPDAKLGPKLRHQRQVLMDYVCRHSRKRTRKTR